MPASLFPSLAEIQEQTVKPTEGELHLLRFLHDNLDESYEVYYQPFINGLRPDIVVMRKNAGVLIIEVKDWKLSKYAIYDASTWQIKSPKNVKILSPFKQVEEYKKSLYDLHIEPLMELNLFDRKNWSIVSHAVYFHNSHQSDIDKVIVEFKNHPPELSDVTKKEKEIKKVEKQRKWTTILTDDNLSSQGLHKIMEETGLNRSSSWYFTDVLYESFKRYLKPPVHKLEKGKDIVYDVKQKQLSESRPVEQKIKGFAGTGKTLILAKRAVNAHKRTQSEVLILSYNISLRNYIHDKISHVREEFNWRYFHISSYHEFINSQMLKAGINSKPPENFDEWTQNEQQEYWEMIYSNEKLFDNTLTKRYKTILIDEGQDFSIHWLRIIKNYFLEKGGEYVIFADEKQNIYKRRLDEDRNIPTNIVGNWNKLDKAFRLSSEIAEVALDFQTEFLQHYAKDTTLISQENIFKSQIAVIDFHQLETRKIWQYIHQTVEKYSIHPNDVCILASKIEFLRDVAETIQCETRENAHMMFESPAFYLFTLLDNFSRGKDINDGINELIPQNIRDNTKTLKSKLQTKLLNSFFYYRHQKDSKHSRTKLLEFLEKHGIDHEKYSAWHSQFSTTVEEYEKKFILSGSQQDKEERKRGNDFRNSLRKRRQSKKLHFNMNPGTVKLSTIHSFKGWETNTLFLILDSDEQGVPTDPELIYTAITRCRNNLFVINIGKNKYQEFFSKYEQ